MRIDRMEGQELAALKVQHGLTDDDAAIIEARTRFRNVRAEYDRALNASAVSDLHNFINSLSGLSGTSSGLQNYIKQAEALRSSFENATGALKMLQRQVETLGAQEEVNAPQR